MIHRLSVNISSFLISHGLSEEDREIFAYGAECFMNLFICDFILLLWAVYCHCVPEMVIWTATYTLLRNHLGGYHTNANWQCIIASILLGIISLSTHNLWLANMIATTITAVMMLICIATVIIIAPVLHPNHPISVRRQDVERIKSIVIVITEVLVTIIVYFFNTSYCGAMVSGIFMSTFFGIIGYFFNIRITDQ